MGLFPHEYISIIEANSKSSLQSAANKLQWALVKGLAEQDDVKVSICNSLYVGPFPKKYKKCRVPTFEFKDNSTVSGINVGFVNLPVVKTFSRFFGVKKHINSWYMNKKESNDKVLVIYALTLSFSLIANYISKRYSDIKVCIIVPDLPEYMNLNAMEKRSFYRILKSFEIFIIRKCIRNIKYFVLLTDAMKTWFQNPINYTVVEGIIHPEELKNDQAVYDNETTKRVIYAGGIKKEYGVADLVSAFCELNEKEWTLEIYGDGVDLPYVKKIAKDCPNVVFYGHISNSIVTKEYRMASLLVNPRKNQELAAYSFPSKISEYMTSGTPMLAYKLDGVPDEYDPFYFHISEEEGGLKKSLQEVIHLPNSIRHLMGENARKFVQENKTPKKQCEKIVQLLQGGGQGFK